MLGDPYKGAEHTADPFSGKYKELFELKFLLCWKSTLRVINHMNEIFNWKMLSAMVNLTSRQMGDGINIVLLIS